MSFYRPQDQSAPPGSSLDNSNPLGSFPLNSPLSSTPGINSNIPQVPTNPGGYNNLSLSRNIGATNTLGGTGVGSGNSNGFFNRQQQQQQQQGLGNLNSTGAGSLVGNNNNNNNNNVTGITSPSLNFNSLYSTRARFNAQKGFEIEDDLEFCPEIQENLFRPSSTLSTTSSSSVTLGSGSQQSGGNNFTHHRFNPYTTTTYTPVSPTLTNNSNTSPVGKVNSLTTPTGGKITVSSPNGRDSPRVITPRAKKVLEIVNPVTGLRVSSPAPYK